jgi:dienelactone hydrolase
MASWWAKPRCIVGLALGVACAPAGLAWGQAAPVPSDTLTIDGAKVDLWWPPTGSPPFPLVLFSHGVSGCRNQSVYLMAALAKAGMIVAAPNHADQRCGEKLTIESLPPEFSVPDRWKDEKYAGRRDQLRNLRSTLLADAKLGPQVDSSKLALVGHSLGGYTVLGLAGALPGTKPNGLRAVVALAPYLWPYANGGTPGAITVPVLIEAGGLDEASANLPAFLAKLGGPACLQVFPLARHLAWVDSPDVPPNAAQPEYQTATATTAIAFIKQAFIDGTAAAPAASMPSAHVTCK